METLLALTVLRFINIGFGVEIGGKNSNMVSLHNNKGNKIYLEVSGDVIEVSVYKVSARCYHNKIYVYGNIDIIVDEIITKLNMK